MEHTKEHILDVYNVIRHTIISRNGPCSAMTSYLVNVVGMERDDLIQSIIADYLETEGGRFDPELSSLNTYINRFIKWRLKRYEMNSKQDKRKLGFDKQSLDTMIEDKGPDYVSNQIVDDREMDSIWDTYAEFLEEKNPGPMKMPKYFKED